MRLQIFDLKGKFIISDKTLFSRFRRNVVCNVVKLRVTFEILLAFFLVFVLFNFEAIGNKFSTAQNFLKLM